MEKRDSEIDLASSITEDIIKYLEQQEKLNDSGESWGPCRVKSEPLMVRSILEELLGKIEDRGEFIEEFQRRLYAHNQFPLFNLETIIPDFRIDDELYKKLSFRETLAISSFSDNPSALVPNIVGGLCLDIQLAKGKSPLIRKDPGLEQKIVELLTLRANARGIKKHKSPPHSSLSLSSSAAEANTSANSSEQELQNFEATLKPQYQQTFSKFLVHVSSQFDVHGNSGGSRISAWVDRNFHTLEEKRREYVISEEGLNEKSLYCALQPRRYYVSHKSTLDDLVDRKYYSMRKTCNLICEGANFLMARYLAITRYIGTFEMSTMYINGDMCRNVYQCTGPESGFINEQKLDLCRVCRTIIEECGIVHHCITLLTLTGQIVKQEWDNCPYILQVNPLAKISNETPVGNEHLLLEKVWETDMQLFSMFLDNKNICGMQVKSYLADHPEFKDMMADYLQNTLLMKPEDVLNFTIEHFRKYYPKRYEKHYDINEEIDGEQEPYF